MNISYTNIFKKHVSKLKKRYRSIQRDLAPILTELHKGIMLGDRISGLDDIVYKVRIKNSDNQKGKSAGYRVIYYIKTIDEVRLLAMYAKSDQENMNIDHLRQILSES